jgi:hypothetical protein
MTGRYGAASYKKFSKISIYNQPLVVILAIFCNITAQGDRNYQKKKFEYERTQKNDSCTMRIFNEKILLRRNLHKSPDGGKSGTISRIGLRLSPLCLVS